MPGERYLNVKTQNVVEVFNRGTATISIATVTDSGYGRRRRANTGSFHDNYLNPDGRPHTTGYVPVNSLPGDHPNAMKTELTHMELVEQIDTMSNAELAELIREQQRIKKEAEDLIDRAKGVAKSRRKDTGTEIHGDNALVFEPNRRFDPKLAASVLSPAQLAMISMMKPDANLAKRILGENSALYRKCQKDDGLKLTVREATDQDRLVELVMAAPGSLDVSFMPSVVNLDESFELASE